MVEKNIEQGTMHELLTGKRKLEGFSGKWKETSLEKIGTFEKGRGIKKTDVLDIGLFCIRYGEIYTKYNVYVKEPLSHISLAVARQSQQIKNGDILFTGSGETAEEIGKCVVYLGDDNCYAGGDTIIFSPIENDPLFLAFLLNSDNVNKQKSCMAQGDMIVHIYPSALKKIKISIPELPEQKAIAETLSNIDELINHLDLLIEKKKNIKQGAIQKLLTEKRRLSGFNKEWNVMSLGDAFSISVGGDLDKEFFSLSQDDKHHFPIYSNSLTNNGLYGYSERYQYEKDSVTVTARGAIGVANARNHPFCAIGRVLVLKPVIKLDCFFVQEFINNQIKFSLESTGVPQLTAPQISKYPVSLPEPNEQTAIAQILSDMNDEIEQLERERDKYIMIKNGMMQKLLTGEIRLK